MKTVQWSVFALMVAAQLAVPFLMIGSREDVLESGVAYKFRCGPVDPYDVMRGRYVALSFPDTSSKIGAASISMVAKLPMPCSAWMKKALLRLPT